MRQLQNGMQKRCSDPDPRGKKGNPAPALKNLHTPPPPPPLTVLGAQAARHDLRLGVARLDVGIEAPHQRESGVDARRKAAVLARALLFGCCLVD